LASQSIPFEDKYFDIVIFTEVFEHLFAPPTEIMKESLRVLCRGGKLIFSTPNFATLLNRIKLLIGICPMAPADNQMKRGGYMGMAILGSIQ
jgi:2-polyprenyl-3-methyl-5-hydroxy-6-metoxy-1,4-benzoquinol methylase